MAPVRFDESFVVTGVPCTWPPLAQNLGQHFLDCMQKHSANIAQIDAASGKQRTHAEVREASIRTALEMRTRGVRPGDIVTICSKNHLDICLPVLGSLYLGATVNTLHPLFTQNELKRMLGITEPRLVFCDETCDQLLKNIVKLLKLNTEVIVFGGEFDPFLAPHANEEDFKAEVIDVENTTAFIICSSGTTGLVKGVTITHSAFYISLNEYNEMFLPDDIMLLYSPLSWVTAIWILGIGVQNGPTRIIAEYDPEENFEIIVKYKVNWILFTPQKLSEMIRHPLFPKYNIPQQLRTVLFGGSGSTLEQINEFRATFPNAYLMNGYGSSEMCTAHGLFRRDERTLNEAKGNSCGKLAAGISGKIIDLETEQPLGRNQHGEFLVKGPALTKGYYKDPVATAKAIDEDGWFHTGDIAYFDDDDCLFVVGRSKELLKYKGWQIAPLEIEEILLTHPAVQASCVVGRAHETDGDLATAFVVKKPGFDTTTENELVAFVNDQVADLQKLRGGVLFIDEIPTTASGKPRRLQLRNLL